MIQGKNKNKVSKKLGGGQQKMKMQKALII